MEFNPGFDIIPTVNPMGFKYGADVFGPQVENRYLRDIRGSLSDPQCDGPEIVYSIAMDVGKCKHREMLERMHLLYGVVTYAAGRLGKEPIRSQGHIHWVSKYSGWSTPEVYEIWTGEAIIYMQEYAEDNPGRCFAVYAKAGDVVMMLVPDELCADIYNKQVAPYMTEGKALAFAHGFNIHFIRELLGFRFLTMKEK